MVKQETNGNNNIQLSSINGDVQIIHGTVLDPSNPGLINCPVCGRLVSQGADFCLACNDNFEKRRLNEYLAGKRRRGYLIIAGLSVIGFVSWLCYSFIPDSRQISGASLAMVGLGIFAVARELDK